MVGAELDAEHERRHALEQGRKMNVNAKGEHSHGSQGDMLVIEDATWKTA